MPAKMSKSSEARLQDVEHKLQQQLTAAQEQIADLLKQVPSQTEKQKVQAAERHLHQELAGVQRQLDNERLQRQAADAKVLEVQQALGAQLAAATSELQQLRQSQASQQQGVCVDPAPSSPLLGDPAASGPHLQSPAQLSTLAGSKGPIPISPGQAPAAAPTSPTAARASAHASRIPAAACDDDSAVAPKNVREDAAAQQQQHKQQQQRQPHVPGQTGQKGGRKRGAENSVAAPPETASKRRTRQQAHAEEAGNIATQASSNEAPPLDAQPVDDRAAGAEAEAAADAAVAVLEGQPGKATKHTKLNHPKANAGTAKVAPCEEVQLAPQQGIHQPDPSLADAHPADVPACQQDEAPAATTGLRMSYRKLARPAGRSKLNLSTVWDTPSIAGGQEASQGGSTAARPAGEAAKGSGHAREPLQSLNSRAVEAAAHRAHTSSKRPPPQPNASAGVRRSQAQAETGAQGAKKRKLAPALSSQAIPPNLLFGGSGGSNFQVPKLLGK